MARLRAATFGLPALLALLALPLVAPAAAALDAECVTAEGYRVCPVAYSGWGSRTGVEAYGDDGTYAEATLSEGEGFFGSYVYLIGIVDVPGTARVHGGLGMTDRGFDGIYENYCVCGAVQTTFLYVPFGVGLEDTTGDNSPDHLYVEPQL